MVDDAQRKLLLSWNRGVLTTLKRDGSPQQAAGAARSL